MINIEEWGKKLFKRTSQEREYHFFSLLFGVIVILLLIFGIFNVLKDSPTINFTSDRILDYISLFFTVTGAVTGSFFIIMGVFVYRTQRALDDTIDKMKKSREKLSNLDKRSEEISKSYYYTLYRFYSEMSNFYQENANLRSRELQKINDSGFDSDVEDVALLQEIIDDNKEKTSTYKLEQARLACYIKAIDKIEREKMIRHLGETSRMGLNQKEIRNDILLLQSIIDDDSEDEVIIEAAKDAIKDLKKKIEELEKKQE